MSQEFSFDSTNRVMQFGAALSTLYLAPQLHAGIIDLGPVLPDPLPYGSGTDALPGEFNLLGGPNPDILQYNDSIGASFGVWSNGGTVTAPSAFGDIVGFFPFVASSPITTGDFFLSYIPVSISNGGDPGVFTTTFTGTFGFLTSENQVGWLRIRFERPGPITYLAGAYNDMPGGTIHAGRYETALVPEPHEAALLALGTLALGAAGLREMRRRRSETASSDAA